MKTCFRKPLFVVVFIAFSFLLLFGIFQKQIRSIFQEKNQTLGVEVLKDQGLPVRLKIPSINVDAYVQHVGVTSEGDMEVPDNSDDVGWFKLGYRPGEVGSAVISGHFNGKNGEVGVFYDLVKLKKGDKLYLEDDNGTMTTFVVRESRVYDPGYAEELFTLNDGAHLNLVTCDGVWDGIKKSYSKRLVVFTDITN